MDYKETIEAMRSTDVKTVFCHSIDAADAIETLLAELGALKGKAARKKCPFRTGEDGEFRDCLGAACMAYSVSQVYRYDSTCDYRPAMSSPIVTPVCRMVLGIPGGCVTGRNPGSGGSGYGNVAAIGKKEDEESGP